MKLSEYAKIKGITYKTAYKHYKKGLIKGAYSLPTGTIIVPDSEDNYIKLLSDISELIEKHKKGKE